MLWNPKWMWKQSEKLAPAAPTEAGFVAWLETKDPKETYNYFDFEGGCAVSQYFNSIDYPAAEIPDNYRDVRAPFEDLAFETPHNFGALLERARAA